MAERLAVVRRVPRRAVAEVRRAPVPEQRVVAADVAARRGVRRAEDLAAIREDLLGAGAAALRESEAIMAALAILVVAAEQATTARVSAIPVTAAGIPMAD